MKLEALIDSIKQSIATGISTPVRIVERTFLLDVVSQDGAPAPEYLPLTGSGGMDRLRRIRANIRAFLSYVFHAPYFNFIILLSGIVITLLLLVAMISFFLSQVILPNPKQYVNDRGTLVFNQPLATEHYMFLLNSANLWADSGIEVIKGDKVQITVSGSFYSDIDELCQAAAENSVLRYNYFHKSNRISNINRYLLDPGMPFGALLYRIERPTSASLPPDSIPPIRETRDLSTHAISFVAPSSGIMHFAVNDIVLTDKNIRSLAADPSQAHLNVDTAAFLGNYGLWGGRMSRKWFDDNCGELLINVKVTRDVTRKSDIPFYDKIFISSMRVLE